MRTFSGRELLRLGKRLAAEAAEDIEQQTVARRADAVERDSRRLRDLLRRRPDA